jgi:hypothetical protein
MAVLAVALLVVASPMSDRSKVVTQTKRGALVFQVVVDRWAKHKPIKIIFCLESSEKRLKSSKDSNIRRRRGL